MNIKFITRISGLVLLLSIAGTSLSFNASHINFCKPLRSNASQKQLIVTNKFSALKRVGKFARQPVSRVECFGISLAVGLAVSYVVAQQVRRWAVNSFNDSLNESIDRFHKSNLSKLEIALEKIALEKKNDI